MDKELKALIESDMKRVYDLPLSAKEKFFFPLQMKYLKLWRKAAFYRKKGGPEVKAGPGLYIGHLGRIIIHPDAVLGKNVNLSTGITIGQANRGKKKGTPVIGDEVWIGTNAVIVGGVKIGNDVLIAPGAYVNFDVPDHSIVMGNPGVIHQSDNATEGYINRKV